MDQTTSLSIVESIDAGVVTATMHKINQFQAVIQTALKENRDFGKIPGTGDKPTLLKPGAEKINMLFGLRPEYDFLGQVEDWDKGFFNYSIRCTLLRGDMPVAQGVGSCNSRETKYRYNNVDEKKLEELGLPTEGAIKFTDKYGRTKYRIENPEPESMVNTVLKMAKKRAYVDATLQVASLSDMFTQDLEDMAQQYQAEAVQTMTLKEAGAITLSFGKHKGRSLSDLYDNERGYLEWLQGAEKTDPTIKKAIGLIFSAAQRKAAQKQAGPEPPAKTTVIHDERDIPEEFYPADFTVDDAPSF